MGEKTIIFTARSMDVFVTKLRKYLKDDPDLEIVNIHGNGFQLFRAKRPQCKQLTVL